METCPQCKGTGKYKPRVFTMYCTCPVGEERAELENWADRLAHNVDLDMAWTIYMHGKIAGTQAMIEQFKKGSTS